MKNKKVFMEEIYRASARDVYDATKSKSYPNISLEKYQTWVTREIYIAVRGISICIKASLNDCGQAMVHIYHTCDDEVDLGCIGEYRTVENLCLAIDKKLVSLAKTLLKEKSFASEVLLREEML